MNSILRKLALALTLAAASSAAAFAITENQAAAIAQDFFKELTGRTSSAVGIEVTENTNCLTFNMSGGGYVVVSTVDSDSPIIGYSVKGFLSPATISPALKSFLNNYEFRQSENSAKSRTSSPSSRATEVAPLLGDIEWGQGRPYNLLTPEIDGEHYPTGCVATAIAQIMRYYKYPAHGTGEVSYQWNGQTLSADLSKSVYNWDLMKPQYYYGDPINLPSRESELAVATLMRDVGYACQMHYSMTGSGAVFPREALVTNFGYDKNIRTLIKSKTGIATIEAVVRDELDHGRPVFFSADQHSYVCDGYDAIGNFHFNYGWSGFDNGYFKVDAYAPDGDDLQICYAIQPDNGGKGVYTGVSERGIIWNGSFVSFDYWLGTFTPDLSATIGIACTNKFTKQIFYFSFSYSCSGLIISGGMQLSEYGLNEPFELPDGEYELAPVFRDNRSSEWSEFFFSEKAQRSVNLTVADGKFTYSNNPPEGFVYDGNLIYKVSDTDKNASLISFISGISDSYKIAESIVYNGESYPVTDLSNGALRQIWGLANEVTVGPNVRTIGVDALASTVFDKLEFAENGKLTVIKHGAFSYSHFNSPISLPLGLKTLEYGAFFLSHASSLTIPESVDYIGFGALSFYEIKDIYVHWGTPLPCAEDIFNKFPFEHSEVTLHVPKGTKKLYEATAPWNQVSNIVEEPYESGIDDLPGDLTGDETNGRVTVYDLMGRRLYYEADRSVLQTLRSGIYVVNGRLLRL